MNRLFKRIKFIFNVRKFIPFLFSYFKSTDVTKGKKVTAVVLIIGYILFPFDMIPDFIAVFGIIDDLAVLAFIMQLIVKSAPQHLKDQYKLNEE